MKERLADIFDKFHRYASSPKKAMRTLRAILDVKVVRGSPLFDRDWYLAQNPDVKAAGTDPALHYLLCGHLAKRDPGPDFCGEEYLALNPGALCSGMNPLVHYEKAGRKTGARLHDRAPIPLADAQKSFAAKIQIIRDKVVRGEKVKVLFYVTSTTMFPARSLFEALLKDQAFAPRLVVIPDLRWQDHPPLEAMIACRDELSNAYGKSLVTCAETDNRGIWQPVTDGADIVCHPLPYDLSSFRYNPRYALEQDYLPIYVNYGYPCTKFANDVMRLENYACFWKVFLEDKFAAKTYGEASASSGANGEITGCMKLDRLDSLQRNRPNSGGKVILIAPHHSVEGGLNNILNLSNFVRFSDYLLKLPARFPEIDFIFRPHPFLFRTLRRNKFWGARKTDAYVESFKRHPNLKWSAGGDYLPEFAASDAIIHDCASFTMEYLYTGKPCCYVLKTPNDIREKFLPVGQECLGCYYKAFSEEDIDDFIVEVVKNGVDTLAGKRADFAGKVMTNYPHAAEAALSSIKFAIM